MFVAKDGNQLSSCFSLRVFRLCDATMAGAAFPSLHDSTENPVKIAFQLELNNSSNAATVAAAKFYMIGSCMITHYQNEQHRLYFCHLRQMLWEY